MDTFIEAILSFGVKKEQRVSLLLIALMSVEVSPFLVQTALYAFLLLLSEVELLLRTAFRSPAPNLSEVAPTSDSFLLSSSQPV